MTMLKGIKYVQIKSASNKDFPYKSDLKFLIKNLPAFQEKVYITEFGRYNHSIPAYLQVHDGEHIMVKPSLAGISVLRSGYSCTILDLKNKINLHERHLDVFDTPMDYKTVNERFKKDLIYYLRHGGFIDFYIHDDINPMMFLNEIIGRLSIKYCINKHRLFNVSKFLLENPAMELNMQSLMHRFALNKNELNQILNALIDSGLIYTVKSGENRNYFKIFTSDNCFTLNNPESDIERLAYNEAFRHLLSIYPGAKFKYTEEFPLILYYKNNKIQIKLFLDNEIIKLKAIKNKNSDEYNFEDFLLNDQLIS